MLINLRKMGNSQGLILPKSIIRQLDFGDSLEMQIADGKVILSKPAAVRTGWAEAAAAIAAEAPDTEWTDLANEADGEWQWQTR
ncbi:AbrB/MazE/SpoVT family DNA-binding domain-containing protein [Neisseria chenwenguii]|uniref:Growth regulator n=1 Tax=Neisseria chenwenguii TaxID=1853278 RepID=A0A220RZ98_9NEIS|nr:growth regulator [Neisseria chenwenguii]ASK26550.1 growth regulator [Neisseria chenwenguii]ROV55992.1 growth regulator [Neisseria chenwenguii]